MVLADDKWPVLTYSMTEEVHNNINKEVKGVKPIYEAILISQILLNASPFNIREDKYSSHNTGLVKSNPKIESLFVHLIKIFDCYDYIWLPLWIFATQIWVFFLPFLQV